MHLLARDAIDTGESGAQGFVTHDQRLQRGLETLDIEHPAQARHATDVVGRAVRFHLPEEPHALLGIGQRHRLASVDLGDWRLFVGTTAGLDQAHLFGKGAQPAVFEQGAQRQLDVAGLTRAGDDLRGQQRMAAKGEEVIAQADLPQAQYCTPDVGDLPLQFGHRFDVFAHLPLRFRQGTTVEFTARAEGHLVQAHQL